MVEMVVICDLCGRKETPFFIGEWYSVRDGGDLRSLHPRPGFEPKHYEVILCDECKSKLASFYGAARSRGVKMKKALDKLHVLYESGQFDPDDGTLPF